MFPFNFIRFSKRPPGKKPPPKNKVDLYWDAENGQLVVQDDEGNQTPLGSGTAESLSISGTISPNMNGVLYPVGQLNGKTAWASNGQPFPYPLVGVEDGVYLFSESSNQYVIQSIVSGVTTGVWISSDYPSRPDAVTSWSPDGGETGTPSVVLV